VARSHGDLSENAEYHAAREQQGLQEARIRQLRQMIENVELIVATDDGVIGPGKLVTISYEGEEPETFLLGLREERGGGHDVLTPESPVGRSLIGHRTGETVVAQTPGGALKVEVLEVRAS
jgi:transcription elongation factor GreA